MSIISNFKNLFKQGRVKSIALYTFTNFFGKAASFFLVLIFTNPIYITPSENGLLSLFSNSMIFLVPFISLGIIHSTSAEFYKLEKKDFKDHFTTGFVLPVVTTIIACIVLYCVRDQLYLRYGFPRIFIWTIPIITFLIFLNEQLLSVARNNKEPGVFVKANVAKIVSDIGLSFILVVGFAWRWEGRVTAVLVSYSLVAIYGIYYFIKKGYLGGYIKKKYILSELVYAVPIVAMQIAIFCMSASDRFFLSHFINDNNETVGIYSIVITFASVIIILCTALLQYIFPMIYNKLSAQEINYNSIRAGFMWYTGIMFSGMLLIVLFTPFIYSWFINEKYYPALRYIYMLTGGYFLWTIAYFFFSFLLYFKEKKKILLLSVCCIATSLLFKYFFIKAWGLRGAAVANISTYLIVLVITLFLTKSYWKHFFIKQNNLLKVL